MKSNRDIESIFLSAIGINSETERDAYLERKCDGDSDMRRRINDLMSAHAAAGNFMQDDDPAAPTIDKPIIAEGTGSVIGPYKLLQQIGEGGFGVVYMAEQTEPVRRKVALKIIKPGMDTKEVIARFEAERQALALMDHPNIAQVFDAGATDSGRPYFVMELVKGIPLIEFCDSNNLSTRDRLGLFVTVCWAIQHAHHKGIIHRDLKPSNVMVTLHDNQPVAKVIDFGVSKAISQQLTERTLFTAYGQMVGTPVYMSPEQAQLSGLDIDTRSDIYSLGVLLYELLTGTTPLDAARLRRSGYAEMQRLIREEETPRPSTRLSTHSDEAIASIAKQRSTDPRKLSQSLRGDLDWIVMKALEKERNRRYDTANTFAADVKRFLTDQAVEACPPSTGYRFRKFARRNKATLATALMVTIALIVGIVGTTWQAIRATYERNRVVEAEKEAHNEAVRANKEAQNAKTEAATNLAVLNFLNDDLLGQADPHLEPDRHLKLSTVLHRASERIEGRFNDQPLVEASIRMTLGDLCLSLGDYPAARNHMERALELNRKQYGNLHAETLRMLTRYAWLEHNEGKYIRAESLLNEVVQSAESSLGRDDPLTLDAMGKLADVYRHLNKLSEAERLFHVTIASMRHVLGDEHIETLDCRNNLAVVYAAQGRVDEATTLHADVLDACRRALGSDHPRTIESIYNLGDMYIRQRRHAEAEKLYLEAFDRNRRVLGPEHPKTLNCMAALAGILDQRGRTDEAQSLRREVLKLRNRVLGPAHPRTLTTLNVIAEKYSRQGQRGEAIVLYRGEIDQWKQRVADDPESLENRFRLAMMHRELGTLLWSAGRKDEALASCDATVDLLQQLIVEAPDVTTYRLYLAELYSFLGWSHRRAGRRQEAKSCYQKSAEHFGKLPPQSFRTADWGHFGQMLYRTGRYAEARRALEKVIELRQDTGPNLKSGPRWWYLIMTLHQLGEANQAREYFDRLVDELKKQGAGPDGKIPLLDEAAKLLGVDVELIELQSRLPETDSAESRNGFFQTPNFASWPRARPGFPRGIPALAKSSYWGSMNSRP